MNLLALIFANYQVYKARILPTDFSESSYIAVSMASLLETSFLAVPLLFLDSDAPSSVYGGLRAFHVGLYGAHTCAICPQPTLDFWLHNPIEKA